MAVERDWFVGGANAVMKHGRFVVALIDRCEMHGIAGLRVSHGPMNGFHRTAARGSRHSRESVVALVAGDRVHIKITGRTHWRNHEPQHKAAPKTVSHNITSPETRDSKMVPRRKGRCHVLARPVRSTYGIDAAPRNSRLPGIRLPSRRIGPALAAPTRLVLTLDLPISHAA